MIQALPLNVPFLRDIPLLTPAIIPEQYRIDKLLLLDRLKWIVLPMFAALAGLCLKNPVLFLTGIIGSILWTPLITLDMYVSEIALDKLAAKDYMELENPSPDCCERLGRNVNALNHLKDQTDNFYKSSSERHSDLFLNSCFQTETFKILANNGFDFSRADGQGNTYLSKLILHDYLSHLEYLVQEGIISPRQFNVEKQLEIWEQILPPLSHRVTASQFASNLVRGGFDINIRYHAGLTPLLKAISDSRNPHIVQREVLFPNESVLEAYVTALLDNGADPRMTVMYEGREQNALELASHNPAIQAIIRERMGTAYKQDEQA
jgi:hypothetical protein